MINPLSLLLEQRNTAIQLFGLPGTYKTTFLLQIIRSKLKERKNIIYLLDTSGNFPVSRLKSIRHLLHNLIIFHPKTIKETALLLDDLNIQHLSLDSILFIDDIFRHANSEDQQSFHLNSYVLSLIKIISKEIHFPVIITNQARSYDKEIYPYFRDLTFHYLNWHFLFEKTKKKNSVFISFFEKNRFTEPKEYEIDKEGYLSSLEI